ncbi:MAG: branched-chain amino acid ABC transporter permease [Dongiaceae bacterium]
MRWRDLAIGLVVLAAFIAIPFAQPSRYAIGQLTLFFIWATVVTQWNLVFGVAGIFSLAQMALFALGGYATGMMGLYLNWSLWAALPVGGLVAVVASLLVGAACLRLRGAYVALLTLAIAQVMYVMIITDTGCFMMDGVTCRNFTGGTRGLAKFGDFGFRHLLGYKWVIGDYYLALAVLALATIVSLVLIASPLGVAFKALRDNQGYARSRGVSRFKYQMLVFAVSAFFTGLAGGVYAGHFTVMGANALYLSPMLFLLAMMIVGGAGRAWGPLAGAALLMLIDEQLKDYVEYRNIGLGLVLILFVLLWPKGIVGTIEESRWFRKRKPARAGTAGAEAK